MDILVNTPGATPGLMQKEMEVPEHIKNMTFSMEDAPSMDGGGTSITTDKGVELKEDKPASELAKEEEALWDNPTDKLKEEKPKVEDKKDEQIKPTVKEKAQVKPDVKPDVKKETNKIQQITPVKKTDKKDDTQDAFDYSKYTQQEVVNMKNMSRQSRQEYAKLIDENKSLSQLKDANYLQHEHGYTLTPEYRDLRGRESLVSQEGNAWQTALLAIKAGKDFKEPIGIDEKTGKLIYSDLKKANDADEIRIAQNLNLCGTELGKVRSELGNYGTQFKNRITQDVQAIQAERKNRFAWVEDPKLLDSNVEVNGQDIPVRQVIEHFKSLLPAYHRSNVIADVAADLFVALQIQSSLLRDAQSGKAAADIKVKEVGRAEPSSDDSDRGESDEITLKGGRKIPKTFSLEGMPGR